MWGATSRLFAKGVSSLRFARYTIGVRLVYVDSMERSVEREDQMTRECLISFAEPFPQDSYFFLLVCWPWSLETRDVQRKAR